VHGVMVKIRIKKACDTGVPLLMSAEGIFYTVQDSKSCMWHRRKELLRILLALLLVLVLFTAVEARFRSSNCGCYYASDCKYDESGYAYRYSQCWGACAAYSKWTHDPRCASMKNVTRKNAVPWVNP